jgi:hypothetical protein
LINWFQLFQQNHYFLKDFGFGEPYDIGTSRQMTFPYMWVTMNEDSSIATGSNNKSAIPDISFSIMFMDKINIQENYLDTNGFPSDNSQEILSDTLQCLQDLVTMIQQNWGQYGVLISQDVSFYPAVDETQDKATGVVGRFVLRTRQVNCIIPEFPYWVTPTPTPTATPEDVTPTPTPSITTTPTLTPTVTPTNTPTVTPTNTPTPTPSPAGGDPDATAYLAAVVSAGGTVDATITSATNTLFTDLKSAGIYSELLAFYPAIGSTSGSTALNGKRSNSQFDIAWIRPDLMTFDYSGATGDGGGNTTGGNTFIIPSNDLTTGNRHMSFYSTNDIGTTSFGYEIGGGNGINNVLIVSYGSPGTGFFSFGGYQTYSNTTTTGFYYTQVSGSTTPYNMVGYKNGTQVINTTSSDVIQSIFVSVLSDNRSNLPTFSPTECSDKRMSWASIGNELTLSQITQFENIVNAFQTTLGRNTY